MYLQRNPHFDATGRILRYLKKSLGFGIWMKTDKSNVVCGYSDEE